MSVSFERMTVMSGPALPAGLAARLHAVADEPAEVRANLGWEAAPIT